MAERRSRLLFTPRYTSKDKGFIQEIGPYYLEDGVNYRIGDNLTENPYSWHK